MKKNSKNIIGLSLAFYLTANASPVIGQENNIEFDPTGLWKTEFLDTVIEITKCKEDSFCSSIYWLNPKDKNIHRYYAKGGNANLSIKTSDVKKLCGFKPDMSIDKINDNHWFGEMYLPGLNLNMNLDIKQLDENTSLVKASPNSWLFSRLKKQEKWKRVEYGDIKYPKCSK